MEKPLGIDIKYINICHNLSLAFTVIGSHSVCSPIKQTHLEAKYLIYPSWHTDLPSGLFAWNKICCESAVCSFDLTMSRRPLCFRNVFLWGRLCLAMLLVYIHHGKWTLHSDGSIDKTTSKLPWLLVPSSMMRYFLSLLSSVWGTAVILGAICAPLPKTSGHAPLHPKH